MRAFDETCKLFQWYKQWLLLFIGIAAFPVGWFYLWLFGQNKLVLDEMNTSVAYMGGVVTLASIIFSINLVRTPFLIIREKSEEIISLREQIETLNQKVRPKLSIVHEARTSPWVQVMGAQNPALNDGIDSIGFFGRYQKTRWSLIVVTVNLEGSNSVLAYW